MYKFRKIEQDGKREIKIDLCPMQARETCAFYGPSLLLNFPLCSRTINQRTGKNEEGKRKKERKNFVAALSENKFILQEKKKKLNVNILAWIAH